MVGVRIEYVFLTELSKFLSMRRNNFSQSFLLKSTPIACIKSLNSEMLFVPSRITQKLKNSGNFQKKKEKKKKKNCIRRELKFIRIQLLCNQSIKPDFVRPVFIDGGENVVEFHHGVGCWVQLRYEPLAHRLLQRFESLSLHTHVFTSRQIMIQSLKSATLAGYEKKRR